MRASGLIGEAWRSAISQLVPFVLIALVGAAMCVSTLLTAGRAAAAEATLAGTLTNAGSRQITVTDTTSSELIKSSVVSAMEGASTVQSALGISAPEDVFNPYVGTGGPRVPLWRTYGDLGKSLHVTSGRFPRQGEAIVSRDVAQHLGLDAPVGSLQSVAGADYPIVGFFAADDRADDFGQGAVVSDAGAPLRRVAVVAKSYADAGVTQRLLLSTIAASDPSKLDVVSPLSLADLQTKLVGDLGTSNRAAVGIALTGGALLIALICLADVLVRRKEIGRRRALGASRGELAGLIVVRTAIPAIGGALMGTAGGVAAATIVGYTPPWTFSAGVATLATLTSCLAPLLPAAIATAQDPVRILRTE